MAPEMFLKLLSDPTRLRSLMLLLQEGELCVCELTYALDEIQPKISRHLAALRDAGIVIDRREGQWIYYRISPGLPAWSRDILQSLRKAAHDAGPYTADLDKLRQMPRRPGSRICA
jgi:ArsR family transcriptional regulator